MKKTVLASALLVAIAIWARPQAKPVNQSADFGLQKQTLSGLIETYNAGVDALVSADAIIADETKSAEVRAKAESAKFELVNSLLSIRADIAELDEALANDVTYLQSDLDKQANKALAD